MPKEPAGTDGDRVLASVCTLGGEGLDTMLGVSDGERVLALLY